MPQKRNNQFKSVPDDIQEKLMYIGQLVKETRLAYGWKQIDFAKQQGISKNSLQNAEYGRNITLLTFLKIIDGLISPSELFKDV